MLRAAARRVVASGAASWRGAVGRAREGGAARSPLLGAARAFSVENESFLTGTSSVYMEEMYVTWKNDPSAVHASWDVYFRQVRFWGAVRHVVCGARGRGGASSMA